MESKSIRCPYQFKNKIVEYYSLFGYELKEEKDLLFSRIKLTFEREEASDKVREVENKYPLRNFLSFYPLMFGCLLIILFTTLFLIFTLSGGDRLTYFLYFMIPVFIILPLVAVYTYLRYSIDSKNILVLSDLNIIRKELEGK